MSEQDNLLSGNNNGQPERWAHRSQVAPIDMHNSGGGAQGQTHLIPYVDDVEMQQQQQQQQGGYNAPVMKGKQSQLDAKTRLEIDAELATTKEVPWAWMGAGIALLVAYTVAMAVYFFESDSYDKDHPAIILSWCSFVVAYLTLVVAFVALYLLRDPLTPSHFFTVLWSVGLFFGAGAFHTSQIDDAAWDKSGVQGFLAWFWLCTFCYFLYFNLLIGTYWQAT
jgi:hypothetical protein